MQWLEFLWIEARNLAKKNNFYLPSFREFWAGSFFEVLQPTHDQILLEDYIKNPESSPLSTPSKKIEIFSKVIDSFNYKDCPGHPSWLEPKEWLGAKIAKKYPLHLISGQPENRLHSQLDNGKHSQKMKVKQREMLKINPLDAKQRNLKNRDIVEVFNDRGACLAGIKISDEVMKGIVYLPVGAWYNPHKNENFCIHGNPNVLTDDIGCSSLSQGPSAHSTLVEIKKWKKDLPKISVFNLPVINKKIK